jgi:hypothetical protein
MTTITYHLRRTNPSVTNTIDIADLDVLLPGEGDNNTSLTLFGRGARSYGEGIQEDLLRLLENFASPDAPVSPTQGQLWYDSSAAKLRVFNGTAWELISGSGSGGSGFVVTYPFVAIGGQTGFVVPSTLSNNIAVIVRGVELASSDYTVNGSIVTIIGLNIPGGTPVIIRDFGGEAPGTDPGTDPVVVTAVPVNTSPPTIYGNLTPASIVTMQPGTWTNSPDLYMYQWLINDVPVVGASVPQYTIQPANAGKTIKGRVIAINSIGASASVDSLEYQIPTVLPIVPTNTSVPVISTTANPIIVGSTILASPGTWINNPTGFTYQWLRHVSGTSGTVDIAGATGQIYTVTTLDTNGSTAVDVSCRVTAVSTNIYGTVYSNPILSNALDIPTTASILPVSISPPVISGIPLVGKTLEVAPGSWNNSPNLFTYRWLKYDGSNYIAIPAATATQYLVQSSDAVGLIKCEVTAINAVGSAFAFTSQVQIANASSVPVNSVLPALTLIQGTHIISSTTGTWLNMQTTYVPYEFTPGYTYAWYRDITLVNDQPDGTPAHTYVQSEADLGKIITCRVTATNIIGSSTQATPVGFTAPLPAAPVNTIQPFKADANEWPSVGETYGVNVGSWENFPSSFTYQWYRGGTVITGQTNQTYTIVEVDRGHVITCVVTATNLYGSTSMSTSTMYDLPICDHGTVTLTSTGNFTLPLGATACTVECIGAGGGGGGSNPGGADGTDGGITALFSLQANGGSGGKGGGVGGAGGLTASPGTPYVTDPTNGLPGIDGSMSTTATAGGLPGLTVAGGYGVGGDGGAGSATEMSGGGGGGGGYNKQVWIWPRRSHQSALPPVANGFLIGSPGTGGTGTTPGSDGTSGAIILTWS